MSRLRVSRLFVACSVVVTGCASAPGNETASPALTAEAPTVPPSATDFSRTSDAVDQTIASTIAEAPTTVAPTTTPTTTTTTTTTTTLPPGTPATDLDLAADTVLLGTSVEGRPLTAERFGTPGGRRVLVIGVIHGDEDAGIAIVDDLRDRAIAGTTPDDIELWLVESMNPDGQLVQDRHNANDVDLNRNFPFRWGPIGVPGDGQYAGPAAASEPETQAIVAFLTALRPDLTLWYHQDANLIIPAGGRDGRVRARYAELSGLPVASCCSGGIYTGIAATWARNELSDQDAAAFIVELPGGDLPNDQVTRHADTVVTIAAELATL